MGRGEKKRGWGAADSVGGRYGKWKDRDLSEGDGNNVKRGKKRDHFGS
jgi:hypothetical protein